MVEANVNLHGASRGFRRISPAEPPVRLHRVGNFSRFF
jgi:hypothetical protein